MKLTNNPEWILKIICLEESKKKGVEKNIKPKTQDEAEKQPHLMDIPNDNNPNS